MSIPTPPIIPEPFAQSGDRAVIPDTTVAVGRASYQDGFPPITMQPKIAGGVPPDGRDVNGILYALSAHALYLQGGEVFKYSSAVASAIGGYGIGAVLESADGKVLWLNLLDGNMSDPDANGASWIPLSAYGFSFVTGLTGGVVTLTRNQMRDDTIVLSGVLVANLTLVTPTNDLRSWRIINNTTGSFTTTLRTSGGVGVTIPQGGSAASVGVFCDGTDIFLQVPPVALPIAVSPDPDTLLKRDNVGDAFARYFNSSALPEGFIVGSILATNGVDTYLRKISLGNLLLQMFVDAALTGNPTAPTQALGNNSTRIATTAFVQNISLGAGQTWQDLTGSRTSGVVYTNTTGRAICVSVRYHIFATGFATLTVDGVQIAVGQANDNDDGTLFGIVPAGATYIVGVSGSGVVTWAELR